MSTTESKMPFHSDEHNVMVAARIRFITIFSILTGIVFAVFGSIYLVRGEIRLGAVELFFAFLILLNLLMLRTYRSIRFASNFLLFFVFVMSLIIFYKGGIGNTGNLWILCFPIMAYFLQGKRSGTYWVASHFLAVIVLSLAIHTAGAESHFSLITVRQTLIVYVAITLLTYYYEHIRTDAVDRIVTHEQELGSIIENLQDIYYRTDANGSIIKISPSVKRIVGYEVEDVLGKPMSFFYFDPGERQKLLDLLEAGKGVVKNFESQIRCKDGHSLWLMVNAYYYYDQNGKRMGIEGIARDITEKNAYEDLLKQQHNETKAILQTIPDDLFVLNESGVLLEVHASDKLYRELLHKNISALFPDDILNLARDTIADALEGNRVLSFEYRNMSNRYFEVRIAPIDRKRLVLLLRDITTMKENEKELSLLNGRLEAMVDNERLKRQNQQRILVQQSKLATMGEMIGAIAHQWKQPINSIAILVQDIRDAYQHGELDVNYLNNNINGAMKNIQFMSETITDFQEFFTPSKKAAEFDVLRAVRDINNLLEAPLRSKALQVEIRTTEQTDTMITGYKNEFKQVILNLINNAADAISERYKNKTLPKGEGRIIIDLHEDREYLHVDVHDNGGGIPEAIGEKIFEPYFTTKEDAQGTGIGLYMSKTIIEENMKGRLSFTVEEDRTTFHILLKKS